MHGFQGLTTPEPVAQGSAFPHTSSVAQTVERRAGARRALPLLGAGAFVAAAVALGIYAEPPLKMPAGSMGRMLPRMPPAPPNVPALLDQLGVGSVIWYAGALALPLALWGVRRVDLVRAGRLRTVAASAAVVLSLALATVALEYGILFRGITRRPPVSTFFTATLPRHLLPWLALTGAVAAIEGRRRTLHGLIERERLRAEVAEQRLIALTGQLQPHFLFNTLQSISTLIHRDADAADEMLAKLGDLLRDVLRHRDRVVVALEDELRYARTYLEIARVRFADRLAFAIDVPPDLLQASVPLFILQPLIENALTHGIGARIRGGSIALTVSRQDDRLRIEVADDGGGLPLGGPPREGIGLSNTRERLRVSFGANQTLSLEPGRRGGVIARIEMPYRLFPVSVKSA